MGGCDTDACPNTHIGKPSLPHDTCSISVSVTSKVQLGVHVQIRRVKNSRTHMSRSVKGEIHMLQELTPPNYLKCALPNWIKLPPLYTTVPMFLISFLRPLLSQTVPV